MGNGLWIEKLNDKMLFNFLMAMLLPIWQVGCPLGMRAAVLTPAGQVGNLGPGRLPDGWTTPRDESGLHHRPLTSLA